MADLPAEGWENAKVDTRKYYVTFTQAFEIQSAKDYRKLKAKGVVCQIVDGKYIATNG